MRIIENLPMLIISFLGVLCILKLLYQSNNKMEIITERKDKRYEYQITLKLSTGETTVIVLYSNSLFTDIEKIIKISKSMGLDRNFLSYEKDRQKHFVARNAIVEIEMKRIE